MKRGFTLVELAVALALHGRRHGQRGHLAGARLGVGVERGAAEDHAVVLDHREIGDFALDQAAARSARIQRRPTETT